MKCETTSQFEGARTVTIDGKTFAVEGVVQIAGRLEYLHAESGLDCEVVLKGPKGGTVVLYVYDVKRPIDARYVLARGICRNPRTEYPTTVEVAA